MTMLHLTIESARHIYERWRPDFRWGYQCCPGELVYKSEFKMLIQKNNKRLIIPIIYKREKP